MAADKYPSLAALREQLGEDNYRIICRNNDSDVTIISPHGGFIEAGTSAIAAAVAGSSFNLFDFQGLRKSNPEELHVTATLFRDPLLSDLLRISATAVAIHGMHDQGHTAIWLGGRNYELKRLVLANLHKKGFSVEPNSPLYPGRSLRNIVNMAAHRGVQLELSNELLCEMFTSQRFNPDSAGPDTTQRFDDLVCALTAAIIQWRSDKTPEQARLRA